MTPSRAIGFSGSLLFAAVAGLNLAPVATACDVQDGTPLAALYLTGVTAAYAGLLAHPRPEWPGAVGVVLAVGAASCLAESLAPTALALTAALAFGRARFVSRGRFKSPLRVELGLSMAALVGVALTVSRSYAGISLAVWTYFLVQSAYFLLPESGSAERELGGSR